MERTATLDSPTRHALVNTPVGTVTVVAEADARTGVYPGSAPVDYGAEVPVESDAIDCNPLSVIVPTHRVVGRCGNIGGFPGGLRLKRTLLKIEENHWISKSLRSDLHYLTLARGPMAAHLA
jgi:O6-methylguanine-DNA--protein-cysteine methyltransferase